MAPSSTMHGSVLEWMQQTGADYTITFRDLIDEHFPTDEAYQSQAFLDWHTRWRVRLAKTPKPLKSSFCLMRDSNPVITPRNQHVEDALAAAEEGNLKPFHTLLEAVQYPLLKPKATNPPPHANDHLPPVELGGCRDQHMHMIAHDVALLYCALLAFRQIVTRSKAERGEAKHRNQPRAYLSVKAAFAVFRDENNVIFAFPRAVV